MPVAGLIPPRRPRLHVIIRGVNPEPLLTVSGAEATVRLFDTTGGDPREETWTDPTDHALAFWRSSEGSRWRFGMPCAVFEPEPVAPSHTNSRLWLRPQAGTAEMDTACERLSGDFPTLTFTTFSSSETGHRIRTYRSGTCELDDEFPDEAWVRLFLPERNATVHVRPWGPALAMHAAELSAHLRVAAAKNGVVPTTILLNHDTSSSPVRHLFDMHVRRATGADTNVSLLDDALQVVKLPKLPPRRAVPLTVPLSSRVRTFAEAVRRRPAFCTNCLPLLRELARTDLTHEELSRVAVELTDTETASELLRVLPSLGRLTAQGLADLVEALYDTEGFTSITHVVRWLQSLLPPSDADTDAPRHTPQPPAFQAPELRIVGEWRDLDERIADSINGIVATSNERIVRVLIIELDDGKFLQFMAGGDTLVAEVSGPSHVTEGTVVCMGRPLPNLYFNGRRGERLSELGFELAGPEENFQRSYAADEWKTAAHDAMWIIREVFDEEYPDWITLAFR